MKTEVKVNIYEKRMWKKMRFKNLANEEKIRMRQSYQNWKGLFKQIKKYAKTRKATFNILCMIDTEIDWRHGYGSQKNSDFSTESLNLLKKDILGK